MKKKPERFMSMPLWQKGLGLVLTITVLIVFFVANSPNSMKPRKSYPVTIAVPSAAKTTMFHNPTRKATRYAVVAATEPRKKR